MYKHIVRLVVILLLSALRIEACAADQEIEVPAEYRVHYNGAKQDGKVLAVLLTMHNCPGCIVVQNDRQYGEAVLRRLPHFMKLQVEDYPELAASLSANNVRAPQICLFWLRKGKWVAERHIGAADIKTFVKVRLLKQ